MTIVLGFIPGERFLAVSITGSWCGLKCLYCMGKYLRGMHQVTTPGELKALAKRAWKRGARGILISGGFTKEGKLPVKPYLGVIRELKREYGFVVSVHTGLVGEKEARELRAAGVDIVDFEVVLGRRVIKEVKGLRGIRPEDYLESLRVLAEHGPPYLAPHVPLGFEWGQIESEYEALNAVSDYDPYLVVVLVLRPTPGTPMQDVKPPAVSEIAKFLREARRRLRYELALGCMRPHSYKPVLDEIAVSERLVDRIAMPHRSLLGRLEIYEACCSVPREFLFMFSREWVDE